MKFNDINFKKVPGNFSKYILIGFLGYLLLGILNILNIFNRSIDNNDIIMSYIMPIFFFLWLLCIYINFLYKKRKAKIEWKLLTSMQYDIKEKIIANKKIKIIKQLEKFNYINSTESEKYIKNISN